LRRRRWVGHVAHIGKKRSVYRILVEKPKGKRPLGRPRCRWRVILRCIFRYGMGRGTDWIDLAQDRDMRRPFLDAVMSLQVP
jgi:hypothetical protein